MKTENFGMLQVGHALLTYFGLSENRPCDSWSDKLRSQGAISIIRDRILDLTLFPGSRIDDKLLVDRFGLGRTPAREAFNRLAAEGLIIMQRNKGAFVRPLDIQHIRQLFDAYIASERAVGFFSRIDADLADDLWSIEKQYQDAYAERSFLKMTQINARFHGYIAVATRNEYIAEYALRLYNSGRRLSYFVYLTEKESMLNLQEMQGHIKGDHDEIIDAVRQCDNERLIEILTRHAGLFHDRVMRVISDTRAGSSPLPVRLEDIRGRLPETGVDFR